MAVSAEIKLLLIIFTNEYREKMQLPALCLYSMCQEMSRFALAIKVQLEQ